MTEVKKARRGFAAMALAQRTEIARKGGRATRPENRAFSKDRELAKAAGSLGGKALRGENRGFFKDNALAKRAGRAGGLAKAGHRGSDPGE